MIMDGKNLHAAFSTETIGAYYEDTKINSAFTFKQVWVEILFITSVLLGIAVDILLVYVILKFKKLNTRLTRNILHFALIHCIDMIIGPLFLTLYGWFVNYKMTDNLICFASAVDLFLRVLCFLFSARLALFVWIPSHHLVKYKKLYKYSLAFVYVIGLVVLSVNFSLCFRQPAHFHQIRYFIVNSMYVCCLVLVAEVNYLNYRENEPREFAHLLPVANWMIILWLPIFLYMLLEKWNNVTEYYYSYHNNLSFKLVVSVFMGCSTPVLTALHLNQRDEDFKIAFHVVNRKLRNFQYSNLDEEFSLYRNHYEIL